MSRFYNLDQAPFNSRELSKAIVAAIAGQYNGAYFDAQDLSTMFQDAAGTTPVTAMEQPVGKWLDKSGKGNHATQSVTASRPVISARYNLVVTSSPTSVPITGWPTTAVYNENSPLLGLPALTITGRDWVEIGSVVGGNVALPVGTYCFSLLSNKATPLNMYINAGIGYVTSTVQQVDTGVYRHYVTGAVITTTITALHINTADGHTVSGFQLVLGVVPGRLQRTYTLTDYDTVGFKKYLKFDGVDDYLNLPYLGLYANGSASIVAARDALSQATDTYVISERSTSNVNPKYFQSRQLANAGNMDAYIVNDAAAVVVDTVGSVYGGASDAVIRSAIDSGNNIKLFKNGALAANDNYTRSGTLTLTNTTIGASVSTTTSNYANMKLYGLAITKSALSDSERRRVERLLAYNSGVQI